MIDRYAAYIDALRARADLFREAASAIDAEIAVHAEVHAGGRGICDLTPGEQLAQTTARWRTYDALAQDASVCRTGDRLVREMAR